MSESWIHPILPHGGRPPTDDIVEKSPVTSTASESDDEGPKDEIPAPPTEPQSLPATSSTPGSKDRSTRYRRKRQDSSPRAESPRTSRGVIRTRSSGVAPSPRLGLRRHVPATAPATAPRRHRSLSPEKPLSPEKHRHRSGKRISKDKPSRADSSSTSRSSSKDRKQIRRRSSSKHAGANSTRTRTLSGSGSFRKDERGVTRGRSLQVSKAAQEGTTKPTDSPSVRSRRTQSLGRSGDTGERSSRGERRSSHRKPRSPSSSRRSRTRRSTNTGTTPTSSHSRKTVKASKSSEIKYTDTDAAAGGDVTRVLSKAAKEVIDSDDASSASSIDTGIDQPQRKSSSTREKTEASQTKAATMNLSTPNMGFDFVGKEEKPKQTVGSHLEPSQLHQSSPLLDTAFESFGSDYFFARNKGPRKGKKTEPRAPSPAMAPRIKTEPRPPAIQPAKRIPPVFPDDAPEQPKSQNALGLLLARNTATKVAEPSLASLPEPSVAPLSEPSNFYGPDEPASPKPKKSLGASTMSFVTTPSFFKSGLAKRLGKSFSHMVAEPSVCSVPSESSPYKPPARLDDDDFATELMDFTSGPSLEQQFDNFAPSTESLSSVTGHMLSTCSSASVEGTTHEFLQFSLNTGEAVPLVRPDDNLAGSLHKESQDSSKQEPTVARTPSPKPKKNVISSGQFDTLPSDFVTPFRPRRRTPVRGNSGGPNLLQRFKQRTPPPNV